MTAAATDILRTCCAKASAVVTPDFIESYSKNEFVPLGWNPFQNRSVKCASSKIAYSGKYVKSRTFFFFFLAQLGEGLQDENESFMNCRNSATLPSTQPPTSALPSALFCSSRWPLFSSEIVQLGLPANKTAKRNFF